MTRDEAIRVFRAWQDYMETADKLRRLMITPPEAFLPYPADTLIEALNIVAKDAFDSGDRKTAEEIQRLMALHLYQFFTTPSKSKMSDEEALEGMRRNLNLILDNPPLKKTVLDSLKKSQDSWMEFRRTGHPQSS